jgi:PX domain
VTLHKRLRTELSGKLLPPLPKKNKNSVTGTIFTAGEDDTISASSESTQDTASVQDGLSSGRLTPALAGGAIRQSRLKSSVGKSPSYINVSSEPGAEMVVLSREEQRVSLRAFLRTILQNKRVAESQTIRDFFTIRPITLNEEELLDIQRRKEMDATRIQEQKKFYEIARQRAAELDVYMEKFRQDIVKSSKRVPTTL